MGDDDGRLTGAANDVACDGEQALIGHNAALQFRCLCHGRRLRSQARIQAEAQQEVSEGGTHQVHKCFMITNPDVSEVCTAGSGIAVHCCVCCKHRRV